MVSRRKLRNKKSHSRKSGGKRVVRVHKRTHKHGRKYSGGFKWPWEKRPQQEQQEQQQMELQTVRSPVNYAITRKPLVIGDIPETPDSRFQLGGRDDSVNIFIKKGINQYDRKHVSVSQFIDAATELVKPAIAKDPKLKLSLKAVDDILREISDLDERNERDEELFKIDSVRLQGIITKIVIPKYKEVGGDQNTDSFKYLSGVYEGGTLLYI